ncbi:MAG: hypothetical protein IPP16_00020 [Acidimicrobiaceae bacterium]|nr:hypothetical protein [Acidimicrobiaceae bacterium]
MCRTGRRFDLSLSGNEWRGDVQVPGATTFDYLVQVVDVNGNIATSTGKGRGLDPVVAVIPDPATVSIGSASSLEGDAGSTNSTLQIVLDRPAPAPITVNYTVSPGTATAAVDYTAANGSASFAAGDLVASIPITVFGDTTVEAPGVRRGGVDRRARCGRARRCRSNVHHRRRRRCRGCHHIGQRRRHHCGRGRLRQPGGEPSGHVGPGRRWNHHAQLVGDRRRHGLGGQRRARHQWCGHRARECNGGVDPDHDRRRCGRGTERDGGGAVTSTTGGVSVVDGTAVVTITDDDVVPRQPSVMSPSASRVRLPKQLSPSVRRHRSRSPSRGRPRMGRPTAASGLRRILGHGHHHHRHHRCDHRAVVPTTASPSRPSRSWSRSPAPPAATIADGSATVTINDDDLLLISAGDTSIVEGDAPGTVDVTITLDRPSQVPVSVDWATANGTASSPSDFTASAGTLTIASGTTGAVTVPIVGDTSVESGEAFIVTISNATFGTITQAVATVAIVDDDVAVAPSVLDASPITVAEGTSGTATIANVPISISPATSGPVTVAYTVSAGTATAGDDFLATTGTLSIAPAQRRPWCRCRSSPTPSTTPPTRPWWSRWVLSRVTLRWVPSHAATVTIADDDATPTITVAAVSRCLSPVRRRR